MLVSAFDTFDRNRGVGGVLVEFEIHIVPTVEDVRGPKLGNIFAKDSSADDVTPAFVTVQRRHRQERAGRRPDDRAHGPAHGDGDENGRHYQDCAQGDEGAAQTNRRHDHETCQ